MVHVHHRLGAGDHAADIEPLCVLLGDSRSRPGAIATWTERVRSAATLTELLAD